MLVLSPSQEIVWLHEQVLPGSRAYNFVATIDLDGRLDETALRSALATAVERHPGLRLELVEEPGQAPRQRVRDDCTPRFRSVDLTGEAEPEAAFEILLRTEAVTPVDPFDAPLLRWCLVRLGARRHRLVHVEHHLIHDGHSFALLLNDVFGTYDALVRGTTVELPTGRSYAEYVESVTAQDRRRALDYWREELRGADFGLTLPGLVRKDAGGARADGRNEGGQLRQRIGPEDAERLRQLARAQGHTPFSTLLTLFGELLCRHSGRTEIAIGTAVGNRPPGFERTVGMFVNTIPLRLSSDRGDRARAAVDAATDTLLRALPYQSLPVQELTRELGLHSGGTDNPLFRVMFSAHDAPLPEIDVHGLDVSLHEGFNSGTSRFDLDVVLIPDDRRTVGPRHGPAGMELVWDFDRGLFTEDTVRLIAGRFLDLLRAYLRTPEESLARLAAAAPAPAADLQDQPSVTAATDAVLDPLTGRADERTAFVSGARTLTRAELSQAVDTLIARLRDAGVTEGQPVACILPRGEHAIVALLACLRGKFVYCSLSPDDPPARLESVLRRLEPALVVTTAETAAALPADRLPVAVMDRWTEIRAAAAETYPGMAYVIHTSGSTGVPKAVLVSRRALAYHARVTADRFGLSERDRALVFARPSFDVSLEEVLPPLLAGGSLIAPRPEVPVGAELAALLTARQVTVANLPTSYLLAVRDQLCEVLRDGRWRPRLIVLGGERLPADVLRPLLDATDADVRNAYGVTEAAITSVVHDVQRQDLIAAEVPLGTELPGTELQILDDTQCPLPPGAVGELAIGGPGLAEGYLRDKPETDTRFVEPGGLGGRRLYLTGDLGYRDDRGRIWFLGRRDNQIKLRGHRIELEEIETVATAETGGMPCAVVLGRDDDGEPRLTGFVEAAEEPDHSALHDALTERLPGALVPGRWVRLDALPLLPGGKPDRCALLRIADGLRPEPASPAAAGSGADPAVEWLAEGWRSVLGHDRFDATSHFFHAGGHSLLAAQLASWLEPVLGRRPSLRVLFQHPVLADQARVLREAGA
ncbi:condensation domain-containing protein [Streptomyces sp. NPDC050759]|uniref:non-ribosomal peptide synthetase n=1 Tax=Streptomyces sp. NPDC050759 TaxID=3365635 RepID=UPI0037937E0B